MGPLVQLCRDGLPGLNKYWAGINVSRAQQSAADVAPTRNPSISSQPLHSIIAI